jgi:hypothetical protein
MLIDNIAAKLPFNFPLVFGHLDHSFVNASSSFRQQATPPACLVALKSFPQILWQVSMDADHLFSRLRRVLLLRYVHLNAPSLAASIGFNV